VLDTIGRPLARRGARALFSGVWTYDGKVIEFQSFFVNKKKRKLLYLHFAYGNNTPAH